MHRLEAAQPLPPYTLVRSARRSIGLEITPQGLLVRAPQRASQGQIDAVLRDKARWIHSKLQLVQTRQARHEHIDWGQHPVHLPYLGGRLHLHLHPLAPANAPPLATGPQQWALHLPCAPDAPTAHIRQQAWVWWQGQARQLYTQRLQHLAPQLGVHWRQLRLAQARTRWGSAKQDGSIMLNTALLHYRLPLIDYVVAHELAHLHEMNHSPRFWAWVEKICPDYPALRAELRAQPMPQW